MIAQQPLVWLVPPRRKPPTLPIPVIFTLGSHQPGAMAVVSTFVQTGVLLIDIRLFAQSAGRGWPGSVLAARFGQHYQHVPALGNLYEQSGTCAIQIADPSRGVQQALTLLERHQHRSHANGHLLLLCACADWRRCHRQVVAHLLRGAIPGSQVAHIGQVCVERDGAWKQSEEEVR